MAAGVLLRAVQIGSVPGGFNQDEASAAYDAYACKGVTLGICGGNKDFGEAAKMLDGERDQGLAVYFEQGFVCAHTAALTAGEHAASYQCVHFIHSSVALL